MSLLSKFPKSFDEFTVRITFSNGMSIQWRLEERNNQNLSLKREALEVSLPVSEEP